MDKDGYPEEHELEIIRTWPSSDLDGLMEFIDSLWWHGDHLIEQRDDYYLLSTGGWSGNEDIIGAMENNITWWSLHWRLSRRGGHYAFGAYKSTDYRVTPNGVAEQEAER